MRSRILLCSGLALACPALAGCDDALGGIKIPSASLNRVDLLDSPSTNQALAWGCHEWFGSGSCALAGWDNQPSASAMRFNFDLVFDLSNDNSFAIPLVEMLLGLTVFEDSNLGALCVSFCDPGDAACAPAADVEGACKADDSETVDEAGDLVPTVDNLVDLATDVIGGEFDNGAFRVIPARGSVETHIQFDLQPETVLSLGRQLLEDAVEDVISGDNVHLEVPYTAKGSLFFDAPELGRKAVGFGPISDKFPLQ